MSQLFTKSLLRAVPILVLLMATGIGAVLLMGGEGKPERSVRQTILPVGVIQVQPLHEHTQSRTFTGAVIARRASELSFRRTGRLTEVLVDDGQPVTEGDVIARLDLRPLLRKQQEVIAQKAEAQAMLDELIAGPRKEAIARAEATVRDLQAQHSRMKIDLERNKRLARTNSVAREQLDHDRYELDSIQAKLEVSQQQLAELRNGTRREKLIAQKAAVARLEAISAALTVDIEDSTLHAPFSGHVSRRMVDEGTVVSPSQVILRIVEDEHLEARIGIPARLTATVEPGKLYPVTVDGKVRKAELRAILPELDSSTRTTTLLLEFPTAEGAALRPGQIARLNLEEQQQVRGFRVPTTALGRGARGLWTVYVAQEKGDQHFVQHRDVEVLYSNEHHSIVRGTLEAGDLVIISGDHRVVPGQQVRARRSERE